MVKHQIVAGPVGHQHIAVGVQNITPGCPHTGPGDIGGNIIGTGGFIRNLHRIQLDAEKAQHDTHQCQQKHCSEFCYSFHVSPPIFPIERTMG
jgi:hypothetical protein